MPGSSYIKSVVMVHRQCCLRTIFNSPCPGHPDKAVQDKRVGDAGRAVDWLQLFALTGRAADNMKQRVDITVKSWVLPALLNAGEKLDLTGNWAQKQD